MSAWQQLSAAAGFGLRLAARVCLYSVLLLVVSAFLAVWYFQSFFPPEVIRAIILARMSEFLDRPVHARSFEWVFFPRISLLSTDLRILDRDKKTILDAPQIWISVAPFSFKEKELRITKVLLVEPVISLVLQKNGRMNLNVLFEEMQQKVKKMDGKNRARVSFEKIALQNARFIFRDEVRKQGGSLILNGEGQTIQEGKGFTFKVKNRAPVRKGVPALQLEGELGQDLRLKGSWAGLSLETIGHYVPEFALFEGESSAQFYYRKKPEKKQKWKVRGRVEPLTFKEKNLSVTGSADWGLSSENPLDIDIQMESSSSSASLLLRFSTAAEQGTTFDFRAEKLRMSEIFSWGKALQVKPKKKNSHPAQGMVQITSGTLQRFHFSDFRSSCSITSARGWEFENLSGNIFDGRIEGNLKIRAPSEPRIEFGGTGSKIQVEQLLALWQSTPSISGALNLECNLSGPLSASFVKEGTGKLVLRMSDGTLARFPIFLKILSAVNLRTIFEKKLGPGEIKKFAFQSLQGDLKFSNGKISTENLRLESKTLSLAAIGTVDLGQKTIDAKVSVRVLTFIDEVLQQIPLLNQIYAEKKSIVPLWVGIKGSLKKPDVVAFQLTKTQVNPPTP